MPRWLIYVLIVRIVLTLFGVVLAASIGPVPDDPTGRMVVADAPEDARLETSASLLPQVVILRMVESANRLYVIGVPDSIGWWERRSQPDVRLRIDDHSYDMRATRIESGRPDVFQLYID